MTNHLAKSTGLNPPQTHIFVAESEFPIFFGSIPTFVNGTVKIPFSSWKNPSCS